ncbi:MAG: molybdopterin-dependent oxidoreductase [Micromonosporaceae bacterium]
MVHPALRHALTRAGAVRERLAGLNAAVRSERLTALLGIGLGTAIGICFVTGVISHYIQHPAWWTYWPSRPVSLYRITQGLHVASGLVAVPLLLAKLWSAYHRLFVWPPVRDLAHGLERASIAVLVGSVLFQLVTGLLNLSRWYAALPFFFPVAHYWTAWIAIGAIVVHVGVKLPVIRRALGAGELDVVPDPSRRGVLAGVAAAVGVVTLTTVGQTLRPLAPLALLGQRDPGIGAQGLPVNKSAQAAGVRRVDASYRLVLDGPAGRRELSLAELAALPQHTVRLPITCVEGWSSDAVWTGVRLRELLDLVGAPADATARVESLQRGGLYRRSQIGPPHSRDPLTLVALRLHGEPLHLDHGYPCRLIAPNRPGVLQTKWLKRIEVDS